MTDQPDTMTREELNEFHVAEVREAAAVFLSKMSAASDAGVSPALIMPMLVQQLRDSGVSMDPGAIMGALT